MPKKDTSWRGCLVVYHEHPEIGKAIARMFLEKLPGLQVHACSRLEDVARLALAYSPVLAWIDVHAPSEQIQGFNLFRQTHPAWRFLGFTTDNPDRVSGRLGWGPNDLIYSGSVPWQRLADELAGMGMMSRMGQGDPQLTVKLTRRQLQLLGLLGRGLSNHEMAQALNISEYTVKVHFWRLFQRLGVNNRLQALYKARHLGLVMENDFSAV